MALIDAQAIYQSLKENMFSNRSTIRPVDLKQMADREASLPAHDVETGEIQGMYYSTVGLSFKSIMALCRVYKAIGVNEFCDYCDALCMAFHQNELAQQLDEQELIRSATEKRMAEQEEQLKQADKMARLEFLQDEERKAREADRNLRERELLSQKTLIEAQITAERAARAQAKAYDNYKQAELERLAENKRLADSIGKLANYPFGNILDSLDQIMKFVGETRQVIETLSRLILQQPPQEDIKRSTGHYPIYRGPPGNELTAQTVQGAVQENRGEVNISIGRNS